MLVGRTAFCGFRFFPPAPHHGLHGTFRNDTRASMGIFLQYQRYPECNETTTTSSAPTSKSRQISLGAIKLSSPCELLLSLHSPTFFLGLSHNGAHSPFLRTRSTNLVTPFRSRSVFYGALLSLGYSGMGGQVFCFCLLFFLTATGTAPHVRSALRCHSPAP